MLGTFVSPNYVIYKEIPNKFCKVKHHGEMMEIENEVDDDIDGKIKVYEDRVKGWFLRFSDELAKERDAGFIVLMIALAYIEGNQQFRDGTTSRNTSTKTMIKALRRILRTNYKKDKILRKIVDFARNGLFHDGMTKKGLILNGSIAEHTLATDDLTTIMINPNLTVWWCCIKI